jgi:hypothetical protein
MSADLSTAVDNLAAVLKQQHDEGYREGFKFVAKAWGPDEREAIALLDGETRANIRALVDGERLDPRDQSSETWDAGFASGIEDALKATHAMRAIGDLLRSEGVVVTCEVARS